MRHALACLALVATGCTSEAPPRDQWQVFITTDAAVPQLGDRILAQLLVPDGEGGLTPCADCQRQLVADLPGRFPVSFGVSPPASGSELWVRARLYRATETDSFGFPAPGIVIDHLAQLPAPGEGVLDVSLPLDTRCLGVAADPATQETCDPEDGARGPAGGLAPYDASTALVAGTSALTARSDCEGEPPTADMVCIPGGLLIFGSNQELPVLDERLASTPEQLVRLSPFWMDIDEYDVSSLRGWVDDDMLDAPATAQDCTWTAGDDALPVNCVNWATARDACALEGKSLPTEAQWEYAATNAGRETAFPFDVVLTSTRALCSLTLVATALEVTGSNACTGVFAEGLVAETPPGDVNDFGVRDLGGSVSEWVADDFQPLDATTCWGRGLEVVEDPRCVADDNKSRRGGNWSEQAFLARSAVRGVGDPNGAATNTGFRCVAPAAP